MVESEEARYNKIIERELQMKKDREEQSISMITKLDGFSPDINR